jgi:quercetin dioxygenase-like cupin family protein
MNVARPAVNFEDDRGYIKDILIREPVDAITVIQSNKGAVRANHYHKDTIQWVYVHSGKLRYVFQRGEEPTQACTLGPGELIKTDILEKHALHALEDSLFYVFTRGPRGGEDYETDTFRLDAPLVDPDAAGA